MKRACKLIEKDTGKRIKLLSLKLNSGYILFSAAMLFLSEAAIAWLNVNTAATMGFLLSATLTAAFTSGSCASASNGAGSALRPKSLPSS